MSDTPGRLLRLLSLLQTPRAWPGPELAARLGVTGRTVRNDVARLRDLGYPVAATRGAAGGYRLAAGTAMPPLLLDDDQAVAVAVALRAAGGAGVAGLEESAVQALATLQQVLPRRLRARVEALAAATERVGHRGGQRVDADLLALVAAAAGAREVLRFGYADHDGTTTERRVEPYRLVATGTRWYLVAFDVERDDWRTFRVDRMRGTRSVGHRFRARPLPADDVAGWVAARTRQARHRVVATVVVHLPAEQVQARMGSWIEGVEVLDDDRCRLRLGGATVGDLARWLGVLDADFEVLEPPELAVAVARLAQRLARAAAPHHRGCTDDHAGQG